VCYRGYGSHLNLNFIAYIMERILYIANFHSLVHETLVNLLHKEWKSFERMKKHDKCSVCGYIIADMTLMNKTIFGTPYNGIVCQQCYTLPLLHIHLTRGLGVKSQCRKSFNSLNICYDYCTQCNELCICYRIIYDDVYTLRCFHCALSGK
jgi:hypothetical protein